MHISNREEKEGPEKGKIVKVVRRRTVYRHSDGYPESVIPDLKEFLEWNKGRNFDIECQAANFIYWSKKRQKEQLERNLVLANYADFPKTRRHMLLSGFGICNNDEFHGDIAFYYEVISDSEKWIIIKCYQLGYPIPEKKEDFKLISTEKIEI
jgi:hypothetical protein